MCLSTGIIICLMVGIFYLESRETLMNEMFIQRAGINVSKEVFELGMLIGLGISALGGTPLLIQLRRKWTSIANDPIKSAPKKPST
jgi:hypothetical protein